MPSADSRPENQESGRDTASQNGALNKERASSDASKSNGDSAAPLLGGEDQTNPGDAANDHLPGTVNGSVQPVDETLSQSKTSLSKAQLSVSKTSISKNSASLGFPSHEINDISHDISQDNGFHSAPKTVILPAVTGAGLNKSPQSNTSQSIKRRFTVTASHALPSSLQTSQNSVARTQTPVSHGPDHIPGVHFKQSNSSLQKSEQHHMEFHRLDTQISEEFVLPDCDPEVEPVPMEQLDQLLMEVDENQKTVQSVGALSTASFDTQDSAIYETSPLQCGNINFIRDAYEGMGYRPKKHYVSVPADTSPDQVTHFMSRYWGMRNPKIVLSVISDIENYKPWKNQRLKDDFEKGIIKAANTTNMWIITNGIDGGIAKLIGDAVRQEKIQELNCDITSSPVLSGSRSDLYKRSITVIGVVPKDSVAYGVFFDGTDGVQIKHNGQKPSTDMYELNPDHTHFIMTEDDTRDSQLPNTRCIIEKQLQQKYGHRKRQLPRLMSLVGDEMYKEAPETHVSHKNTIPVVGLLIQGSPRNIDHVLYYLHNKMPIVVLKGSGGLADVIGFAYEELLERGDDLDYQENFLKPELIKFLTRLYSTQFEENDPAKLTLRDKIIECARLATESSGNQANMTVVNIKGWGSSLKDLDKFILMALFKEKHEDGHWRDELQSDLQLAVDWNRPDLATQIFQQDFARARVDKHMFEKSLLKKDREELVELFLSQGVRIHKFLNHKKLKLLFERAEDREFFLNVCMEQGLGLSLFPDQPFESSFLSTHLNKLICKLTGLTEFIKPYEMSLNYTGMYSGDPQVAERRAMNALMIWAVLMNRHKLAKTLWTKCDEPICIALICSMICLKLSKYTMEQFQKTEIQNQSKEYGEMALGVLAICWQDSSVRAYNMLSKHHEDYNNKTIVEIAYDATYTHFLAHPCCQKWLTKTFFGNLQVKELNWGLFRLPYWFKILASVFLIIPMYIWITFIPPKKNVVGDGDKEEDQEADEEEVSDEEDFGDAVLDRTKSAFDVILRRKTKENLGKRILRKTFSNGEKDVPFWLKIQLLWTAPITKFWTAQAFYFIYLAIFCLATLWPTCGNFYLDLVLWSWTAVILMELVFRVYMKYKRNRALSLVSNCIEICLILMFLIALLLTRIITSWVTLTNYVHAKTILCYGLIYFFYRLVGTYLLISPTLGPMIHKVNGMIKHDFVAFARMFLIFMIAGGVTIQAIIYPNWPLTIELIRRVITRPIYAMFLTEVTDLAGDETCSPLYKNSSGFCASRKVDGGPLQKCPYSSLSGYVITIQYLLICKLILVTLLYAMFSHTIQRIDNEASQIWKFQRYALIADLLQRFSLPPPFTIFSVLILCVQYMFRQIRFWICSCCKKKRLDYKRQQSQHLSKPNQDDRNFWKQCAREFMSNVQVEKEKTMMPEKHGDILISLTEDLKAHRKSMKRLGDRVVELERMVQSSRLYLEDISHKLDKTDVKGITDVKGQFIHVAARQSPYPGTSVARFPVFDKYVPWELTYEIYDPKLYTLSKESFPENEMSCVDEDILDILKQKEERALMSDEELHELPPLPVFKPKWNAVVTYKEDGIRREINRRSWIDKDNQPLRYSLDPLGIPINPMGRTGIRGKGALWRWGPNHVIKAVVTRWRKKSSPELIPIQSYVYVEGKRVLEFIAVAITEEFFENLTEATYNLPGAVLLGDGNKYSCLCKAFMTYVLDQPESEQIQRFDQSDVIQYFSQFSSATVPMTGSLTHIPQSEALLRPLSDIAHRRLSGSHNMRTDSDQGFSASLLYKGYLDDPRNTDNAWVETEVWNFHYDLGDEFDLRLKGDSNVKWKEISPYVNMFGNESAIVQEAAKIHDAYH